MSKSRKRSTLKVENTLLRQVKTTAAFFSFTVVFFKFMKMNTRTKLLTFEIINNMFTTVYR